MTDLNLLACCLLSLLTMGQELSTDRRANPDGSETTTTVTAEEMWQHFQGELPVLHKPPNPLNAAYPNDIRFDDRWTTDIPLLVVVSDKGDVVRADVQGDLKEELGPSLLQEAAAWFRNQHFVPFYRDGNAVFVQATVSLRVLPPEKLRKVHAPFPEIKDPRTLVMSLLRSGSCPGCPDYRIEIHGDGTVKYDGYCTVEIDGHQCVPANVQGHRTSRISQEAVNFLFNQFKEAEFFSLDKEYVLQTLCLPELKKLSITFDGHKKTVSDYMGLEAGMPDAVTHLEHVIDSVANSSQWMIASSAHGCG